MILFQNYQNIRHGLAICFRMFKDDFTGFYLFLGYTYNKQKNINLGFFFTDVLRLKLLFGFWDLLIYI